MEEKKILTEEEEADEIVRRLRTPPFNPKDFQRIVMPVIRKVIPGLIAQEIIGVQPMTVDFKNTLSVRQENKKDGT